MSGGRGDLQSVIAKEYSQQKLPRRQCIDSFICPFVTSFIYPSTFQRVIEHWL